MAGADVIDDRLPVGARGLRVAHDPVPQVRVLGVQQFVEGPACGLVRRFVTLVQPTTQQGVEFARAAAGTPTQAGEAHAGASPLAPSPIRGEGWVEGRVL